MLQKIVKVIGGDPNKREIQKLAPDLEQINELEAAYESLSDDALHAKTDEFRKRLAEGETLDDLLPEAFAAVREASKRTLGMRHYDVQMIGGIILHQGKIAEMRTGEGKTLVATLPLYLNALTDRGVHLVTVNDYLARRDARWMAPIYTTLGMSVGVLQSATRTDNGKMAFLVDPEVVSPHEDQHQLRLVPRAEAYRADIVYGTNSEFGFDYLRDNLVMSLDDRVQRGHYYAIVDEVDNILIDEARTPLIISGPASDDTEWYVRMIQVVRQLNPEDYEINEKDHTVTLTELGEVHVEELLNMPLGDPERPEDITPEQARVMGYLEQVLRAQFLYKRNKDYLVQAGKVIIVDEFTGRLMPGRRWSEGLHQAVEAKEGVKIEPENITYATITLQNYFRMYEKLAGMTGTALTEAEEFHKIYKLEVLPVPMNLEYIASLSDSHLTEVSDRDEAGYRYSYYARRDDTERYPVFWRRKDYPDVVYRTEEAKLRSITQEIVRYYVMGRPQLVGTTSVEHSERLSDRLQAEPLRRLLQILIIRQAWIEKNNIQAIEREIEELKPLNRPIEQLELTDIRATARSLGLTLNLEEPSNQERLLKILDLQPEDTPRLVKIIQGGIPHQVLNARKHDEESQIIARAGAFGSVTIATNMAGRGVDIKLGGELPEDILQDVVRVLGRAGYSDPYDMNNEERRQALLKLTPEDYGIYEESVNAFLQYLQDMERVRELGGLHVIGSERHEARRIDNQLRGRSARQGDPGSSRFYLSLEDELMRLFGGQQVENLWKRLMFDESQPLEVGILGRLVEQSQERVEGTNFDVRKHLLEYDDVLNSQRNRIYTQRDRVFTKADLSEDVLGMLQTELQERIPKSLKDEEGPWKLLAFLEEIQPPLEFENVILPSFNFRLLLDLLHESLPETGSSPAQAEKALLDLADKSIEAEKEHVLRSTREILVKTEETLQQQRQERFDALDTFVDALGEPVDEEESAQPRRPQEILAELSEAVRIPFRLTPEQLRRLAEADEEIIEGLRRQIETFLLALSVNRLVATVERRLGESFDVRPNQLQEMPWEDLRDHILEFIEKIFNQRKSNLLGENGQITRDLDAATQHLDGQGVDDNQLIQMMRLMVQGTRMAFDRKTHRQGWKRYDRLSYVFLAARLIESAVPQEITNRILNHLEDAQQALQQIWGMVEWNRLRQNDITLQQVDENTQRLLSEKLGAERFMELANQPLIYLSVEDHDLVCNVLGWQLQNEAYRELLLQVISQQWVDYLTRVEALRVSIGLEAYAQRDPLVQYKSKATEMFLSLLADIRMAVISRMFTYQPRRGVAITQEREIPVAVAGTAEAPARPVERQGNGHKKKRRHH
jgi:preprotein translocase subunit SecA